MLLEVKDFLHKNKKFAENYKGPFIITRVSENNMATIKTPHGTMEYNYNIQIFNLFHPKKEEEKKSNRQKSNKINKKI